MPLLRPLAKALAVGAVLAPIGLGHAFEPQNVECLAPADPGGGWDFTCRQTGKVLQDLKFEPSTVQVTNMPGAGGGVAYSYVVSRRNDDPNLTMAASTATTTRLAQGQFVGMTAQSSSTARAAALWTRRRSRRPSKKGAIGRPASGPPIRASVAKAASYSVARMATPRQTQAA